MNVLLKALIKKVEHKSLVSGDKSTQILLEVDAIPDDVAQELAKFRSDEQYTIAISNELDNA